MTTMDVGDRVNVQYAAYAAGVATTATMALVVTDPDGATTTPTITPTSPNLYDASFTLTTAGVWTWVWTASGTVVDVQRGQVTAQDPAPPTYASLALLKQALGLDSSTLDRDDLLLLALNGASRSVEQYCDGRVFNLATTASARTFPLGRNIVRDSRGERVQVDDIGALDGLVVEVSTNGTTWTAVTAYSVFPDNALAKGEAVSSLLFRYATSVSLCSYTDLRVTARWGWPQVPTAVEQATLLQATRLYRRKDSPQGVAGSSEWGLIRVPNLDPDVQRLLAHLKSVLVA